jgi:hypothetical protein
VICVSISHKPKQWVLTDQTEKFKVFTTKRPNVQSRTFGLTSGGRSNANSVRTFQSNLSVVASNLEAVKNIPTAQLATVVNSLSKDGLTLLPTLSQIVDELNHSFEYGITVLRQADLGAPSQSDSEALLTWPSRGQQKTVEQSSPKESPSPSPNDRPFSTIATYTWEIDLQKKRSTGR